MMWLDANTTTYFERQVNEAGCVTLEVPAAPGRFITPSGDPQTNVAIARTAGGAYVVLVPQDLTPRDASLAPLFHEADIVQGWRVLRLPYCSSAGEALAHAAGVMSGDVVYTPPAAPTATMPAHADTQRQVASSDEDGTIRVPGPREEESDATNEALPFTHNLTEAARRGELADVAGRETELAQVITILLQRERNSPLLCGEPGVGKTAIVEKLALLSAQDDALPPRLNGATIFSLDVPALLAASSHKGAVEKNVTRLLDGLEKQPQWILFADEVHTLSEARGDIAITEMLKPRLARGLRLISATTHAEFKTKISPDAALVRRFDVVNVAEPDVQDTTAILRARLPRLQEHHGVSVSPDLLERIVKLADEYFPDRRRPDKALTLLDRAMAAQSLKAAGINSNRQEN